MRASRSRASRSAPPDPEETRELILRAAEVEFAGHGFARARLEDIAERVSITRAAILYHFRDKQALYDAVLEATFQALTERTAAAIDVDAGHAERIERIILAWIAYTDERPTLARLLMREIADSPRRLRPELQRLVAPLQQLLLGSIEKGQRAGVFRPMDPARLVGILAGSAVWCVTGAPLFGGSGAGHLSEYREELLGVTRYLLGTARD